MFKLLTGKELKKKNNTIILRFVFVWSLFGWDRIYRCVHRKTIFTEVFASYNKARINLSFFLGIDKHSTRPVFNILRLRWWWRVLWMLHQIPSVHIVVLPGLWWFSCREITSCCVRILVINCVPLPENISVLEVLLEQQKYGKIKHQSQIHPPSNQKNPINVTLLETVWIFKSLNGI